MTETLHSLQQRIHSITDAAQLSSELQEIKSAIAGITFEGDFKQELYYVNHTGREFLRKAITLGLTEAEILEIADVYDAGYRPIGVIDSDEISIFTITLQGANGTYTGGGELTMGTAYDIVAIPNALYDFTSWTLTSGVGAIADTSSAATKFTPSNGDATITANYIIVPAPSLSGSFTDPDVSLTASVVEGTATYQFQRSTSSDFSSGVAEVQNTASNTLSDSLSSAATYYYRVRSVNGSTQTEWSNTATFTISLAGVGNITEDVVGWWDPSDASTITTTSNSEVTSVTDKSGNGYTFAPLTTNKSGPTIGTTTQNGLNVFEYSNTIPNNQVLENNNFSWDQSNNEIAFAIVFHCNDEGTLDQDFLLSGTETQNPRLGVRRTTGDGLQIIGTGTSVETGSNVVVEGQTYMTVLKFNGTNTNIRLDGTQRGSGNIGTNSFSSLNIGTNFQEDQSTEGFIAEIIAFSDSSQTEFIEGYLAHKWGLESNLPANHPYKSQAPLTDDIIVPVPSLSGSFTDPDVSLTASVVEGTATYQFQRSTSSDFSSGVAEVQNTASNTLSDSLSSAATYYYRVRSVNGSTQSEWSNTATFTISLADASSFTTLNSWYDVSDNSTITEVGGIVTTIADKSGNSNDLTANSASTDNHTLLSASQNGLDVVDLDGDDRYNATSTITVPSGNASFFIVCKVDTIDSSLDSIFATTGTNSFQYQSSSTTDFLARITGPNGVTSTTDTDYKGAYHIFNALFDFDGGNNESIVDGAVEGSVSYTSQLGTSLNLRIFTNRGQNAYPAGQLAEIVICTDVTTTTRQKVEGYLAHKWGLESNLPTNHPYKSQAPLKSS